MAPGRKAAQGAAGQAAQWNKEKKQGEELGPWTWEPPAWEGRKPGKCLLKFKGNPGACGGPKEGSPRIKGAMGFLGGQGRCWG